MLGSYLRNSSSTIALAMDYEEGDGDHPEMSRLCFGTLVQVLLFANRRLYSILLPANPFLVWWDIGYSLTQFP